MTALWNEAFVYAEKQAVGEAEKVAEGLKVLCQRGTGVYGMAPYEDIRSFVALLKGEYAGAIDGFRNFLDGIDSEFCLSGSPVGYRIYWLALAYYRSADMPRAREQFEKLTNLTAGRWPYGDLYAKGFYWLGKIAEDEKDKGRARENYRRFLDLWKDADPGFPEVDDAKARLAALS